MNMKICHRLLENKYLQNDIVLCSILSNLPFDFLTLYVPQALSGKHVCQKGNNKS